jgi:hypothetical protein
MYNFNTTAIIPNVTAELLSLLLCNLKVLGSNINPETSYPD